MKKLRFGLIGCGRIGIMHARNLASKIPSAKLVAVADPKMTKQTKQELEALEVAHFFKAADDLIVHPAVEAIFIATPTVTHIKLIEKIIEISNKPIFCEKPLSTNWKDLIKLSKQVKAKHTFLQLGYNRRFDIGFQNVKKTVASGALGKQYLIAITSFDPAPPSAQYVKEAGMLWTDMNIHDFDMVRNISGSEITSVFVQGANLVAKELSGLDVDVSVVNMQLQNGALGIIQTSRKSPYGYDQRVEVLGANGQAKIENERPSTFRFDTTTGRELNNPYPTFVERYREAFIKEIESFVANFFNNKPPVVALEDDLKALKVARACEVSYKENRLVKLAELK